MNDTVRSMLAMCASNSDPASLTSQTIPIPDPGPGELLVEVCATAITADELPRTGSGKILKRQLRAPYWAGRTAQVG